MPTTPLHITVCSRQAREQRVVGIILSHLKSARHEFVLVPIDAPQAIEIAIVDAGDAQMLAQARLLESRWPGLTPIYLVDRPGQSGARHELLPGQMMARLMPLLQQIATERDAATAPRAHARFDNVVQLVPTPPRQTLRALVVDDSPTVRTQLANVVQRIGMQCDSVDGAEHALTKLAHERYDLIFVDVVMPDMDGYKLTREIKRDRRHKGTPVIILTSQSSPFDRARGALAGCDLFLTKPVAVKAFYEATTKALRKSMAVDDLSLWLKDPSQVQVQAPPPALAPAPMQPAPMPAPRVVARAAVAPLRATAQPFPHAAPLPPSWDPTLPLDDLPR